MITSACRHTSSLEFLAQVEVAETADFFVNESHAEEDSATFERMVTATEALGWRMAQLREASRVDAPRKKPSLRELIASVNEAKAHSDAMFKRLVDEARNLEAAGSKAAGKRARRS